MPESSHLKDRFGPALPENYFLPSPFLLDKHRAKQTRERVNQKLNTGKPAIRSHLSKILVEKLKETYYNKESKRCFFLKYTVFLIKRNPFKASP